MSQISSTVAILADKTNPCIHIAFQSLISQQNSLQLLSVCQDTKELEDFLSTKNSQFIIIIPSLPITALKRLLNFSKTANFFVNETLYSGDLIKDIRVDSYSLTSPETLVEKLVTKSRFIRDSRNITFSVNSTPQYIEAVTIGKDHLNDLEINILRYLCSGYDAEQIGRFINSNTKSVQKRIYKIRDCLGVESINELIVCAFRGGLIN